MATGRTERLLRESGIPVLAVAQVTGTEEMLEGRVKTLHPAIHAGILARRDHPEDMTELGRLGFAPIDLVCCNLYPFANVVAGGGVEAEALAAIDIGGPTLLRAAAKNFASVLVVSSPGQYPEVLQGLRQGGPGSELRRRLAHDAFRLVSEYDRRIADYLAPGALEEGGCPTELSLSARLVAPLRYGENPHQSGGLYQTGYPPRALAQLHQVQGDPLSYINWLDLDAARALAYSLPVPAAVIVKHANPCGVALGSDPAKAFAAAYECDPRSAYGGIVALNCELDEEAAKSIAGHFLEVLVVPKLGRGAGDRLQTRPRLRVLEDPGGVHSRPERSEVEVRSVDGGLLAQTPDWGLDDEAAFQVTSGRQPTDREWSQLRLAWAVCRAVRSNAIVLCRDDRAMGIGAGQMSRVEAVELAVRRAGEQAQGSVLASDAFFPMADGLEVAAEAGVSAAIHPGGSKRDPEVIAAADRHGMALVATGRRHFRH